MNQQNLQKDKMNKLHPDLQINNKCFIALIVSVELIVLLFLKFFYRIQIFQEPTATAFDAYNAQYYPFYQDVNVMMLVGFGFLMTFIKYGSWQALAFTFVVNAIVIQLYLLWSAFWVTLFHGTWDSPTVDIKQKNFTAALYCVASVLIAFGAVLGRVGPYQFLLMGVLQVIGYTLNETVVYELIKIYDVGGSTVIHTFGAYFGLTVSLIIGLKKRPKEGVIPESNKISNTYAMIGTFFLWMFWPSFNAGFFPNTPEQRTIIIMNTIISLTGSCLGTFIVTSLFREKFQMEDILNASLAGGVAIGAPAGLFTNPAASLTVGLAAGVMSTFGFVYLSAFLKKTIHLNDTCGVHNLHGIPGLFGGILSAIAVAAYQSVEIDSTLSSNLGFHSATFENRSFSSQGWYQLLGTFSSLGIGIVAGLIVGALMTIGYEHRDRHFYRDTAYFQTPEDQFLRQPQGSMVMGAGSYRQIQLANRNNTVN